MITVGLQGYQLDRIRVWQDPWLDRLGDGLPHHPGPARARHRRAVRDRPRREQGVRPERLQRLHLRRGRPGVRDGRRDRRHRAVPAAGLLGRPGRARRRRTRSGRCWRPASPPGCASRRSSTSGSSWPCCRSPGSRCRSSAPAAHPSSSASPRSGSSSRSRARPWTRGRGTTMRLLIAAGGTGGHIYPALAVARSLRASPEAPELRWLGGHRGLEATLVPAAGIPLRRLAARSLRTTEADVHAVLDPIRLGAVRAAGGRDPGAPSARPRSSRPAATSRCRS